jgi:hypothetical protein
MSEPRGKTLSGTKSGMRIIIKYILFLLIIIAFSCEESGLIVNCDDCKSDEPTKVNIEVKLESANPDIGSYTTNIKIYEGNLEDSLLLGSFWITNETWQYQVELNKQYTFTATYTSSSSTWIAVDAVFPRVKYEPDQCKEPCYYIYDKKVNLKLKYTK